MLRDIPSKPENPFMDKCPVSKSKYPSSFEQSSGIMIFGSIYTTCYCAASPMD